MLRNLLQMQNGKPWRKWCLNWINPSLGQRQNLSTLEWGKWLKPAKAELYLARVPKAVSVLSRDFDRACQEFVAQANNSRDSQFVTLKCSQQTHLVRFPWWADGSRPPRAVAVQRASLPHGKRKGARKHGLLRHHLQDTQLLPVRSHTSRQVLVPPA